MLVLSRKNSEAIVVGNATDAAGHPQQVIITVLRIGHGFVKLGIEAPGSVAVHRLEVWDRVNKDSLLAKAS